ncbi:PTS transporter subunit EIIB [Glaesserella sp.]|uniref:PTS transporter subunit EIIB n=1 Tax=Glaesserella sp. TaxID=2094731 RepID=UPI00359F56DA
MLKKVTTLLGKKEREPLENVSTEQIAQEIIEGLGGKENIKRVDACITRLRVQLASLKKTDKAKLKAAGAVDSIVVGDSLQVILGKRAGEVRDQINQLLG